MLRVQNLSKDKVEHRYFGRSSSSSKKPSENLGGTFFPALANSGFISLVRELNIATLV